MSLVQGQPPKDNGKYSVLRQVNYDRLGVRFFMEDYPIKEVSELPSLVSTVIKVRYAPAIWYVSNFKHKNYDPCRKKNHYLIVSTMPFELLV